MKQDKTQSNTQPLSKKNMTAYWGIPVPSSLVINHPTIKKIIELYPNLKLNKKFHITLLYVGKKISDLEEQFKPLEGKPCEVTINCIGHSENAIALGIDNIAIANDTTELSVPFHGTKRHITIALGPTTKAVDSVKCLLGEGTVVDLDGQNEQIEPIKFTAPIKRFLF